MGVTPASNTKSHNNIKSKKPNTEVYTVMIPFIPWAKQAKLHYSVKNQQTHYPGRKG